MANQQVETIATYTAAQVGFNAHDLNADQDLDGNWLNVMDGSRVNFDIALHDNASDTLDITIEIEGGYDDQDTVGYNFPIIDTATPGSGVATVYTGSYTIDPGANGTTYISLSFGTKDFNFVRFNLLSANNQGASDTLTVTARAFCGGS